MLIAVIVLGFLLGIVAALILLAMALDEIAYEAGRYFRAKRRALRILAHRRPTVTIREIDAPPVEEQTPGLRVVQGGGNQSTKKGGPGGVKGYYTNGGYMGWVDGEGYRPFETEDAYYDWKNENSPTFYEECEASCHPATT